MCCARKGLCYCRAISERSTLRDSMDEVSTTQMLWEGYKTASRRLWRKLGRLREKLMGTRHAEEGGPVHASHRWHACMSPCLGEAV